MRIPGISRCENYYSLSLFLSATCAQRTDISIVLCRNTSHGANMIYVHTGVDLRAEGHDARINKCGDRSNGITCRRGQDNFGSRAMHLLRSRGKVARLCNPRVCLKRSTRSTAFRRPASSSPPLFPCLSSPLLSSLLPVRFPAPRPSFSRCSCTGGATVAAA